MRKLSKKISMLMVLAMLVSLFSGVVSASAASSWSFANKTDDVIVAVKETIEMEKNQFADFDLYKDGKAFDTDVYTVKYESSDADVVWVDAKNGKLRADKFGKAEAGDTATISALIENKNTGAKTTKSFKIEIAAEEVEVEYTMTVNFGDEVLVAGQKYDLAAVVKADGKEVKADVAFSIDGKAIDAAYTPAKAGEYTIVAVATVDGEEVAKVETAVVVAETGIVSAKQVSFNTVAITCDSKDAAAAIAADATKLGAVYVLGENEIVCFVKSLKVDEKNANVVNVELYNNLIKDITYKFTYADKAVTVKGADLEKYAAVALNTNQVDKATLSDVKINLYDANGVLVAIKDSGFGLEAAESGDYYVSGDDIYFYEAGKAANVKITYYMGYDNDGNKINDLVANETIVSVDLAATSASAITGFSVDGGNNWTTSTITLAVNENKVLGFKFDVKDFYGNSTENKSYNTAFFANNNYIVTYATTNDSVLLVDGATGDIFPVAAGTAQIIVYRAKTWDANNKEVIGVCTFNVIGGRDLTSISPVLNKTKLAYSADNDDDSVKLTPNAKDQTGAGFAPDYYFEIVSAADGVSLSVNGTAIEKHPLAGDDGDLIVAADDNGTPVFYITADSATGQATTAQIAITAKQPTIGKSIMRVVTLQVKEAGGEAYYGLDAVSGNIDMNIPGRPWWASGTWYYETAIKLNAYDSQGYLVKIYDTELDATADGANGFYYTFMKGGTAYELENNTFKAVSVVSGGTTLVKFDDGKTGTYTVRAYKKMGAGVDAKLVATKNIVVTDSTTALTVTQKNNKLTTAQATDLTTLIADGKLEFKRAGKDVTLNIVDFDATINTLTTGETRVYVTKVKVAETYDGLGTFEWWTNVGKVFEVAD